MFLLWEWEINPHKKIGIQLGFETKTFWILVRRFGREAEDKLHKQNYLEASAEFQLILTLSELDWTEPRAELCNL